MLRLQVLDRPCRFLFSSARNLQIRALPAALFPRVQRSDSVPTSGPMGQPGALSIQELGEVSLQRRLCIRLSKRVSADASAPRSDLGRRQSASWKGFARTYAFSRDFAGLVGRFKLDWVFVSLSLTIRDVGTKFSVRSPLPGYHARTEPVRGRSRVRSCADDRRPAVDGAAQDCRRTRPALASG